MDNRFDDALAAVEAARAETESRREAVARRAAQMERESEAKLATELRETAELLRPLGLEFTQRARDAGLAPTRRKINHWRPAGRWSSGMYTLKEQKIRCWVVLEYDDGVPVWESTISGLMADAGPERPGIYVLANGTVIHGKLETHMGIDGKTDTGRRPLKQVDGVIRLMAEFLARTQRPGSTSAHC